MKALSSRPSVALLVAAAALAAACAKEPAPAAAAPAATPEAAPAAAVKAGTLSGTVLETMNSGGYTYIRLETASGEAWAAVGEADVKVGSEVTITPQMTMTDF